VAPDEGRRHAADAEPDGGFPAALALDTGTPAALAFDDDLVGRPGVEDEAESDEADDDADDERDELEAHAHGRGRFRARKLFGGPRGTAHRPQRANRCPLLALCRMPGAPSGAPRCSAPRSSSRSPSGSAPRRRSSPWST